MNAKQPLTFALYFGNRGFFPGELIASARQELAQAVEAAGYQWIMMPESETRYGAVETREEGAKYAAFLKENAGKYQGVILCLPNFGDENGAMVALADCGTPVLVQAYRDMPGRMDFAHRRDSMCGKFAICNVLRQCGIRYTIQPPFTIDPAEPAFGEQLHYFAGVCRVVNGMRRMNVGAIGARTTAFKTVRVDEVGLQRHGVNVETFDLSEVFRRMKDVTEGRMAQKREQYLQITHFGFPQEKLDNIARLGAVVDDLIAEYDLHAVAIRCWNELELAYGIAPCLVLCELNERGVQAPVRWISPTRWRCARCRWLPAALPCCWISTTILGRTTARAYCSTAARCPFRCWRARARSLSTVCSPNPMGKARASV